MRIAPDLTASYESPNHKGTHEVFVSKRQDIINVEAKLEDVIANELKIPGVKARIHSNYLISDVSGEEFQRALPAFLAEMPVDEVRTAAEFDESSKGKTILRIEANPGQYSQKVDYLNRCFDLQKVKAPNAKFYNTIVLERDGKALSPEETTKIQKYLVNIVEERAINKEERYKQPKAMRSPEWYDIVGGFRHLTSEGLTDMVKAKEIPLEIEDLLVIQKYFKNKRRDPSILELLVLATYWSDHCRHTTFHTELGTVEITADPALKKDVEKTLKMFHDAKKKLGKQDEPDNFMNMVTTPPKHLKRLGVKNMKKVVTSDEVNAFTYETEIQLEGGKKEKYLVMFKNETHNSPTQSAPFGGAATCFGGAVRDNLSNRGFTFYAMRVSGSADPTEPLDAKTMGDLSQIFISQYSALGHASYANQMGTAAGVVEEYFSPGYRAKHFECGYVIAYAPQDAVRKIKPNKGDKIIQFGGYTGRDGYLGASVSSDGTGAKGEKATGSHVQNGNPVVQSAIQSLMLDTEFTRLIKRSNDFGAGGIAVACGEIAPGVDLWIDKQKKKYTGLTPEELAICESQERMAMVISPEDWKKAQTIAEKYNLELTEVGLVTSSSEKTGKVRMLHGKNVVLDIDRSFIDSAGAQRKQDEVHIELGDDDLFPSFGKEMEDAVERFLKNLERKEVALSGVGRGFDNSIGATVVGPYGGKTQLSPQIAGTALLPTFNRSVDGADTNPHGLMSQTAISNAIGFALPILEKNSYVGAMYSIIEFVSKMIAVGVKKEDIFYGLQEYFEKLGKDKKRWGKVHAMLLGAFRAQVELMLAAIGGKDSASGSGVTKDGKRVDVPPTLVALGNGVIARDKVVSAEFKKPGSTVLYFPVPKEANGLPKWKEYAQILKTIEGLHKKGQIASSSVVKQGGPAATIAKMSIGNNIGFEFGDSGLPPDSVYVDDFGGIIVELNDDSCLGTLDENMCACLGKTTESSDIILPRGEVITSRKTKNALTRTLEPVYPTKFNGGRVKAIPNDTRGKMNTILESRESSNIVTNQPLVLIPVFPGTNSHHDTAQAARRAGFTNVHCFYFNTNPGEFEKCVKLFGDMLKRADVTVFPGGFSAGDQPDGSAKYTAMLMRMNGIKEHLQKFIDRGDTLTLGICNGFQLLIKLGLFSGEKPIINDHLGKDDMTLTYNDNLRHVTDMVGLRVRSTTSPWMSLVNVGDTFVLPISHGEGRLLGSAEQIRELIENGQATLQYVDENGRPTNKYNGSVEGIAALTSRDGRVLGLMPHPERAYAFLMKNIPGNHHLPVLAGAAHALGVNKNMRMTESGLWMPN